VCAASRASGSLSEPVIPLWAAAEHFFLTH
jgi:hypothetical protein